MHSRIKIWQNYEILPCEMTFLKKVVHASPSWICFTSFCGFRKLKMVFSDFPPEFLDWTFKETLEHLKRPINCQSRLHSYSNFASTLIVCRLDQRISNMVDIYLCSYTVQCVGITAQTCWVLIKQPWQYCCCQLTKWCAIWRCVGNYQDHIVTMMVQSWLIVNGPLQRYGILVLLVIVLLPLRWN